MVRWIVSAICLVALSGCADVLPPEGLQETDTVHTASGEVTVAKMANGQWEARRTEIGTVAFAGGDDVTASTVAGSINIDASATGKARAMATLWARGDSEEEARQLLGTLRFDLGPGMEAHVRSDSEWRDKGGAIVIQLPTKAVGSLSVDVTAGAVTVTGLDANDMGIQTTAGAVQVTGTVDDLDIDGTSGAVALDLKAGASGAWRVETQAGAVSLKVVESQNRGYDVRASTTAGAISMDLDDTEVVSSQSGYAGGSRHERTNGFSGRAIQTEIELETTAAAISVRS